MLPAYHSEDRLAQAGQNNCSNKCPWHRTGELEVVIAAAQAYADIFGWSAI